MKHEAQMYHTSPVTYVAYVINEARTYVYWSGQITVTRCTNYWETALKTVTSLEPLGLTRGRPGTEP